MSTELFAGPLMVNPFALIEAFFQIFNGMVFATLLIVTLLKDRLFAPLAINAEPLLLETPPLIKIDRAQIRSYFAIAICDPA